MFDTLKTRIFQGNQFIKALKKAQINENFRGLPLLQEANCKNCKKCVDVCPTNALSLSPFQIDLGKCTLCGECKNICEHNAINFSNFHKLATTKKEHLIINSNTTKEEYEKLAIETRKEITSIFSRSLKLRQVCAGGCNSCEMELNACSNVNFDMGRFGIDFVASPRHADGIVITGPITQNMAYALEDCYKSTPDPKIVILCGTCAISGGVFQDSKTLNREFLEKYPIDLYIPGCPVHPLTFINGILGLIRK